MTKIIRVDELLREMVTFAGDNRKFCDKTGMKQSNLSNYLSNKSQMKPRTFLKYAFKLFGEPPAFRILAQYQKPVPKWPTNDFKNSAGVYAFYDSAFRIIYFGKAKDFYSEIRQRLSMPATNIRIPGRTERPLFRDITHYISAFEIVRGDPDFRHDVEILVLHALVNSALNKNVGNFKRTC